MCHASDGAVVFVAVGVIEKFAQIVLDFFGFFFFFALCVSFRIINQAAFNGLTL